MIPLNIKNHEISDFLSSTSIRHPISELENIVNQRSDGHLIIRFSHQICDELMPYMDVPMEPILKIGIEKVHGILDSLRHRILDWALKLEQEGIMGEGMTFSNQEKKDAGNVTYKITNNIGSMQNSQFQQATNNSQQSQEIAISNEDISSFIQHLKSSLTQLNLNKNEQAEIEAEIATIDSQLASPKPKKVVLGECLKSVRNIIEGATASLVSTGLLAQLGSIIGSVS